MVQNNSHPQTTQPDLILTPDDSKGTIEEHSGIDDGNDPIPNQDSRPASGFHAAAGLLALALTVARTLWRRVTGESSTPGTQGAL